MSTTIKVGDSVQYLGQTWQVQVLRTFPQTATITIPGEPLKYIYSVPVSGLKLVI
jgi:hypothetical protein